MEDYPYAGMEFHADPDLVLPPGATWGTIGEIEILIFDYVIFFMICSKYENEKILLIGLK